MNQMTEIANLRMPADLSIERSASQYEVEFDPSTETLWGFFNPRGTPCFNLGLLADIRAHDGALEANGGHVLYEGRMHRVSYYVAASRTPGIYSLGGDLGLFLLLIRARDRDALLNYGKLCIDNVFPRVRNYFCPTLTTISLVQGDALGGGFETAMASDVIIAEKSAVFGLPEVLFNLFPGMGAYSILSRRIGRRNAEDLILSGRVLSAVELHDMGLVDVVAADGEGETAVCEWIAKAERRRNGMQAVFEVRKRVDPIERDELDRIVEVWVDAALRLEEKDLRMMERLVRSQVKRVNGTTAGTLAERLAPRAVA